MDYTHTLAFPEQIETSCAEPLQKNRRRPGVMHFISSHRSLGLLAAFAFLILFGTSTSLAQTQPPCGKGYEKSGAFCYPECKAGYNGVGPVRWERCPAGFTNDG